MADSKISALPSAGTLTDADVLALINGGSDTKVTLAQLITYFGDTLAITPPSGWYVMEPSILSTGAGSALVSGRAMFNRIPLGVGTYDAALVNVTTAQSGGTVTFQVGMYPDDGTGGWPDTSASPLATATLPALTGSIGTRVGTFGSSLVVSRPAIYWACSLYISTVTPGTVPIMSCINNNIQTLPRPSTSNIGIIRGYTSTGQTGLPTTPRTTGNIAVTGASDVVAVAIRRA